jgi:hypothetical protein
VADASARFTTALEVERRELELELKREPADALRVDEAHGRQTEDERPTSAKLFVWRFPSRSREPLRHV